MQRLSAGHRDFGVSASYCIKGCASTVQNLRPFQLSFLIKSTLTSTTSNINHGHYPVWCLFVSGPHPLCPTTNSRMQITPGYIQNVGTGTVLDLTNGSHTNHHPLLTNIYPAFSFSGQQALLLTVSTTSV